MKAVCDQASGELDSSNFTKPLPAIGLYIVAASLACFLFMALDILISFRDKIYWIKCKFFKLNALSLSLLSIATKLPGDLNTSMPGPQHQLTKVSGVVFLCVSMGFFFPSIGTMGGSEALSNAIALAILVLTVAADIGIQIGTGAIFTFIPEHILLLCMMLHIMLTMVLSSRLLAENLRLVLSKDQIERKRDALRYSVSRGTSTDLRSRFDSYKRILTEVWTTLYSNDGQRVMNKESHSCAAGLLSILSAVILVELEVRYFLLPSPSTNFPIIFCKGDSDYGWSIPVILISQTLVALLASLAISFRLFHGIDLRNPCEHVSVAVRTFKNGIGHCMRVQRHYAPSKLEDVGHKARWWAGNLPRNLAMALVWLMIQAIAIINHSIYFIVSIVPFLVALLSRHYFSRANRNEDGTISSAGIESGKPGSSCFSCNSEHVLRTWFEKGRHRPTTHLFQLLTIYEGLVDYTDWSGDPIWLLFREHVNVNGSCYFFLAAIVRISRSLFESRNPSAMKNFQTAVKEANKLLLFVEKWLLPKHDVRMLGITVGKHIWYLMNSISYRQADAQGMITDSIEEVLKKAREDFDISINDASLKLATEDVSSIFEFKRQLTDVSEGILNNIPMSNFIAVPDRTLDWLRARTMNLVVYCLSVILYEIVPDVTYIMKLQMEDVREAAHVLGMIQALEQPLFPMFEVIYSRHPTGLFQ